MREDANPPAEAESAGASADEGEEPNEQGGAIPREAFFDPDDPLLVVEGEIPEDAFFSPDGPLFRTGEEAEGVVTGMAGGPGEEGEIRGDLAWEIRRTSNILESLARALRDHGMEALRVHPETDPMDAMLRSFVAGYLVGREGS